MHIITAEGRNKKKQDGTNNTVHKGDQVIIELYCENKMVGFIKCNQSPVHGNTSIYKPKHGVNNSSYDKKSLGNQYYPGDWPFLPVLPEQGS